MNKIEIPIQPMPAPRLTHQGRFTKRAKEYFKYKNFLWVYCTTNDFQLSEKVRITFYMEIPKSITKKEKTKRLGNPHKQRPDLDNLVKGVWDGLAKEDGYIHYLECSKFWAEEGKIVIENIV